MSRGRATQRRNAVALAAGFMTSRMLHEVVKLGIAELLAHRAAGAEELARVTGTHPASLERLLRGLIDIGFVRAEKPGHFRLTPQGQCLCRDHPYSIRQLVLECGAPHVQAAWTELGHTLRTGRSAFSFALGTDYWAYVGKRPDLTDGAVQSLSAAERAAVAAYDLSTIATLVDVGGGRGDLLAAILERNPRMTGIVFDLDVVSSAAATFLAATGLGARATFVGGDFFTDLPAGADAYLLAGVLRDWSDADARRILTTCRRAAGASGRLLVVEPTPAPASAVADLHRLVLFGPARERSADQLRQLVADAGFAPRRALTLAAGVRLVEAMPSAARQPSRLPGKRERTHETVRGAEEQERRGES